MCVCVCPNFYFHKDPSHTGLGPTLLQYDFIKPVIPIRACFQIKPHSESSENFNTWIVFQPMNACMHARSVGSVVSDSLNPMDCSPPGSSVHEILQARILEWVAMPSTRGSSWPRDRISISCWNLYLLSHLGSPSECVGDKIQPIRDPMQQTLACII